MSSRILTALVAVVLLSLPAGAQTKLDRNEIINSLTGLPAAGHGVTAALLRQQALDNIAQYPGDNATTALPLAAQLAKLRQFNVEIVFDFDSATIRPESYETIGLMADALHHPYLLQYRFLVIGHTDAKGDRKYNLELSQKRADSIRDALTTTFRVDPARLDAVGLGEEQLRDPADPYAQVNRRVQLINIGE
ncbi:OmpA family protein [Pseudoxanthobacter sp. M-2]|uniref:OmpA family protein n=1 Tax=Pseudoxanthobacter sp. M-2 TaxID=3078754 RepID=UPI0038FCBF44